jgi:hypothetical protein
MDQRNSSGSQTDATNTRHAVGAITESRADQKDGNSNETTLPTQKARYGSSTSEFSPIRINRFYPLIPQKINMTEFKTIKLTQEPILYNALKADLMDIFLQHKLDLDRTYSSKADLAKKIAASDDSNESFYHIVEYLELDSAEPLLLYKDGYFGIKANYCDSDTDKPIYLARLIEETRIKYGAKGEEFVVMLYLYLLLESIPNSILNKFFGEQFLDYCLQGCDFIQDETFRMNADAYLEINSNVDEHSISKDYMKVYKKHNAFVKKMHGVRNALKKIFKKATGKSFTIKNNTTNVYYEYFIKFMEIKNLPEELKSIASAACELGSLPNWEKYIFDLGDDITYVSINDTYRFLWAIGDYGDHLYADYNNAYYEAEGASQGFSDNYYYWPSYSGMKSFHEQNPYQEKFTFIWDNLKYIYNHGNRKIRIK